MGEAPTREQRIEACLQYIRSHPDFPAFDQHIQQLMAALDDQETSFHTLTDLVLRDYNLTLRVLQTANSVQYNRSGRPVLSVTHAVVLLGVDAIRYIAGGLALFQHFRGRSPGGKELMLMSLLTANCARSLGNLIGYPHGEEAYLCGMFRNLGEVLIASYFPNEYASIQALIQDEQVSQKSACLRVLQFSFEEFGQAVAREWNVPDKVSRCMGAAEKPCRTADSRMDQLSALTSFSHAMTAAVHHGRPEDARLRADLLFDEYLPLFGLKKEQVSAALDEAIRETKSTFAILSVPLDDLCLRRQMKAALLPEGAEAVATEAPGGVHEIAGEADLLDRLVREVESILEHSPDFHLNNVLLMILEAMYRGAAVDRVLFSLINREHTLVQGRLGLGYGIDSLRERFRFPISPRGGPLGIALLRKQDLFGSGGPFGASGFGLLPTVVDGLLVGCFYFDRLLRQSEFEARTRESLCRLRDLASRAFGRKRSPLPAAE